MLALVLLAVIGAGALGLTELLPGRLGADNHTTLVAQHGSMD